MPANDTLVTVVLVGVGIYFSVLLARGMVGYLLFRRLRETALLTWSAPRSSYFALVLGLVSLAVAVWSTGIASAQDWALWRLYGQYATAAYFLLMVPLSARIRLGLYRDGVWADSGFLPYARIGRMAFREQPEIVLLLVPKGRDRSLRLPVPRDEYGAVRKVLEEKIRERAVNVEAGILGL
jgi:hypothetical protein